ncbi:phytoene/squalene synthase family protein [Salinirubellus salinus]|uniref:Phytoene/squalene synthase family protein n=1 Tax=Salinirubellus salinus TaxID=1364945 RepID=A0A9E7R6Z2_9EURY|nr:phytoene/squalene synthase family protein [Salinirubellus salinus]UWM56458.1 phytoene/squalene synthase family protein [Salinirubellus salinus]
MVDSSQLAESKEIHRKTGRTFYYATRLLPERVRHATYVLYAFFRVADEVVDDVEADTSPAEQRRRLEAIREAALGREPDGSVPDAEVLAAFSELRERYGIPDREVEVFVEAMLTDIEKARYETYEELETYMRGSASAVGVMMTYVMEPDEPEAAMSHAQRLGEAFQLTNFVRDVGEDIVERDRIYLPRETLETYGVTEAQIRRREYDEAFAGAVEHELRRAESLYREGVAGIKYLPEDCQLPVLTAAVLYADHHRLVRRLDGDTLTRTPELSPLRKALLVAKTWAYWRWHRDPEAVFARVSAVPTTAETRREPGPGEPLVAR